MTPHYEVEVPEHEPDFAGAWRTMRVFPADAAPSPLAFGSLNEARAYVVRVNDEGEREVVGPDAA